MIPYDFQRRGVEFLLHARRALLADDMGLGKTAQAILACEAMGTGPVLVVCPNTLKSNWADEVAKWVPSGRTVVLRGTAEKKERSVREFDGDYLVVNIEAVRPCARAGGGILSALLDVRWKVLVVDEAHAIKGRRSQQTKGVAALAARTKTVYLMTGTPIMNRVDDLWSPLHVLYPRRYPSFWSFVKHHASAYPGKFGWVIDGRPTRPGELRAELAPFFLRREKEEVFPDMPAKLYQRLWLEMEGEQDRIYREIEKSAMAQVTEDTVVVTPGVLAQITRCRQVAFSAALIGGPPDSVKMDALVDVARGTDRKMLVFSQFAEAVKMASERLTSEGIAHTVFIGETREEDRDEAIRAFQNDPGVRAFLATTQAGGSGLNLTAASLVVFLDKHWTPAVNEQAVDRTRPHMQRSPVQVVELLCRGTVDEMVEDVLSGKMSIIEAVIKRKKEVST